MGTNPESGIRSKSLSRARVLIVDDDVECAALVARSLAAHAFHVQVTHDADTALVEARALDPHVAILDLHLRHRGADDGHVLGQRIREESTRAVQIVMLTGDEGVDANDRSEALGFAAHLVKPVRLEDLARLVQMLVARSRRPDSSPQTPIIRTRKPHSS